MSALPLPPPSRDEVDGLIEERATPRAGRPGQLTGGWQTVFIVGWVCVLLGIGAVARSADNLGLSTWWLGPRSDPNPLVIRLIPAIVAVVFVILGACNVRFLPYLGAIGAIVLGAIAVGDLDRFDRLAVTELIIAGSALLISVACFAGLLHRER